MNDLAMNQASKPIVNDLAARSLDEIASELVMLDLHAKSLEQKKAPLKAELIARMTRGNIPRVEMPMAVVSFVASKAGESVDTDALVILFEKAVSKLQKLGKRFSGIIPMKPTSASATVKITHRHGLNPDG